MTSFAEQSIFNCAPALEGPCAVLLCFAQAELDAGRAISAQGRRSQ
jgi:hypothetical protein